jgi:hypothetical protein
MSRKKGESPDLIPYSELKHRYLVNWLRTFGLTCEEIDKLSESEIKKIWDYIYERELKFTDEEMRAMLREDGLSEDVIDVLLNPDTHVIIDRSVRKNLRERGLSEAQIDWIYTGKNKPKNLTKRNVEAYKKWINEL